MSDIPKGGEPVPEAEINVSDDEEEIKFDDREGEVEENSSE